AMTYPRLLLVFAVSAAVALAAACSKSESTAASSTCGVSLGSVPASVSAAGATGTIPVTAASTCSWTAASSAGFLTVTSGASGTGNGSVGYSIAANAGAARSASISVNGTVANFTQQEVQLVAPKDCAISVSTTSAKANSGGGTTSV